MDDRAAGEGGPGAASRRPGRSTARPGTAAQRARRPYDQLNGKVLDGLAVYRARASLGLRPALFAAEGVPVVEPPDDWQPAELAYTASFGAGPVTLTIPATTAATSTGIRRRPRARTRPRRRHQWSARATRRARAYDGAPNPRWWQIEDHRHDPGAVAPHRTQLAALMLIHVTASHGDDWFTAPWSARRARSWP